MGIQEEIGQLRSVYSLIQKSWILNPRILKSEHELSVLFPVAFCIILYEEMGWLRSAIFVILPLLSFSLSRPLRSWINFLPQNSMFRFVFFFLFASFCSFLFCVKHFLKKKKKKKKKMAAGRFTAPEWNETQERLDLWNPWSSIPRSWNFSRPTGPWIQNLRFVKCINKTKETKIISTLCQSWNPGILKSWNPEMPTLGCQSTEFLGQGRRKKKKTFPLVLRQDPECWIDPFRSLLPPSSLPRPPILKPWLGNFWRRLLHQNWMTEIGSVSIAQQPHMCIYVYLYINCPSFRIERE